MSARLFAARGTPAWRAIHWPPAAGAQPTVPVIGFLNGPSPERFAPYLVPFRQGLSATGYTDVTELVGMTADGPFSSRPG